MQKLIKDLSGEIGLYYKNLMTGEIIGINDEREFLAASIIKIPILLEAFRQTAKGKISFGDKVSVSHSDKVPDCGALTYMHDGLEVTIMDLCNLMIILSDNTATNILTRILGMKNINKYMENLGLHKTRINRLLFDDEEQKKGKENYFSPKEMGFLLDKIFKGQLISENACRQILEILKLQQIRHKIPYHLPSSVEVAHKTGEDEGITHDVGIIFSKKPFILCFATNNTNVTETEEVIRQISRICFEQNT